VVEVEVEELGDEQPIAPALEEEVPDEEEEAIVPQPVIEEGIEEIPEDDEQPATPALEEEDFDDEDLEPAPKPDGEAGEDMILDSSEPAVVPVAQEDGLVPARALPADEAEGGDEGEAGIADDDYQAPRDEEEVKSIPKFEVTDEEFTEEEEVPRLRPVSSLGGDEEVNRACIYKDSGIYGYMSSVPEGGGEIFATYIKASAEEMPPTRIWKYYDSYEDSEFEGNSPIAAFLAEKTSGGTFLYVLAWSSAYSKTYMYCRNIKDDTHDAGWRPLGEAPLFHNPFFQPLSIIVDPETGVAQYIFTSGDRTGFVNFNPEDESFSPWGDPFPDDLLAGTIPRVSNSKIYMVGTKERVGVITHGSAPDPAPNPDWPYHWPDAYVTHWTPWVQNLYSWDSEGTMVIENTLNFPASRDDVHYYPESPTPHILPELVMPAQDGYAFYRSIVILGGDVYIQRGEPRLDPYSTEPIILYLIGLNGSKLYTFEEKIQSMRSPDWGLDDTDCFATPESIYIYKGGAVVKVCDNPAPSDNFRIARLGVPIDSDYDKIFISSKSGIHIIDPDPSTKEQVALRLDYDGGSGYAGGQAMMIDEITMFTTGSGIMHLVHWDWEVVSDPQNPPQHTSARYGVEITFQQWADGNGEKYRDNVWENDDWWRSVANLFQGVGKVTDSDDPRNTPGGFMEGVFFSATISADGSVWVNMNGKYQWIRIWPGWARTYDGDEYAVLPKDLEEGV